MDGSINALYVERIYERPVVAPLRRKRYLIVSATSLERYNPNQLPTLTLTEPVILNSTESQITLISTSNVARNALKPNNDI